MESVLKTVVSWKIHTLCLAAMQSDLFCELTVMSLHLVLVNENNSETPLKQINFETDDVLYIDFRKCDLFCIYLNP